MFQILYSYIYSMEILYLLNKEEKVSRSLYDLWQRSYRVEANIVGVTNFPPLNRTELTFQNTITKFIGILDENRLVTALEFLIKGNVLDIYSLVVDPDFFRKGYGQKIMSFVLNKMDWEKAIVETAEKNLPAISLYKKLGFEIVETYSGEMGISKVKLEKQK